MKVLYPHKSCTKEEIRELLEFAIESRRRVKLQLMKMDETFREREVRFAYQDLETGKRTEVFTLEELQYNMVRQMSEEEEEAEATGEGSPGTKVKPMPELEEKHIVIKENQKGVSYQKLFAPYLKDAKEVHLIDPYLRKFHQVKNLMEFCEMLYRIKPVGDEIRLKVFTNAEPGEKQEADSLLIQVQNHLQGTGIDMDYEIEPQGTQHARSLETDTGWKIILDRGLDIFQRYDYKDAFNLANALQEERMCKPFEVTYVRV